MIGAPMLLVTIMPPDEDSDLPITREKWRYMLSEVDGESNTLVGTLHFADLRQALLRLYRDEHSFRICNRRGTVIRTGDQLDVITAQELISDRVMWAPTKAELERKLEYDPSQNPHDPVNYPDRVVTNDGQWHSSRACKKIKAEQIIEQPTAEQEDKNWWSCKACVPPRPTKDDDLSV